MTLERELIDCVGAPHVEAIDPIDGPIDGPTDGPTDGPIDGPTDGPTDGPRARPRARPLNWRVTPGSAAEVA